MRISDWSSDVCSSDLGLLIDYRGILKALDTALTEYQDLAERTQGGFDLNDIDELYADVSTEYKRLPNLHADIWRSEEHTSALQALMRNSYADFCWNKKNTLQNHLNHLNRTNMLY